MNLNDKNLINELVIESREHLDGIEPDLLAMESNQNVPKETINRIFRAIHSIKGGFSFFGMENIKSLSHAMENMMMKLRDGEFEISTPLTDALFTGIDKLRILIDDLNASDETDISQELHIFEKLTNTKIDSVAESNKLVARAIDAPSTLTLDNLSVPKDKLVTIARQGLFLYIISVKTSRDLEEQKRTPIEFIRQIEQYGEFIDSWVDMSNISGLDDCLYNELTLNIIYSTVLEPDLLETAIVIDKSQFRGFTKDEVRSNAGLLPVQKTTTAKKSDHPAKNQSVQTDKQNESSESIRVKVSMLNQLVNLAGELVLCRNQLMQQLRTTEDSAISSVLDNIDIVTSELQESIMTTRMQPLSSIFSKFPRQVRDLSHSLGKEVELVLQGEGVELDKSIIESLTDPLTHLLRNSVDHGIESPEIRKSRGKPPNGKILLHAFHEGGQVLIEIQDDGNGINIEKVKEKAITNGLVRADDADKLSEKDIYNLIFEAGFSTAEKVTDVSGRGVGMDVVKTNIENLSGSVDISSELYKGTTVTLRLPLTLAIIPALTVECMNRRFAIPQVSLDELVHLHAKDASRKVEKINGKDVLRLRGKLLPLVRLSVLLQLQQEFIHPETKERMIDKRVNLADRRMKKSDAADADQRTQSADRRQSYASAYNIIVLKIGMHHFGLIVDKLIDTEEIVVKPLSSYLKSCRCYSGATIMGDGKVAMILDPGGIAEMANLKFNDIVKEEMRQAEQLKNQSIKESQSFLLFRNANAEYMALNLSLVRRIEATTRDKFETIGQKSFLKYDDYSMRVIRPSEFLPIASSQTASEKVYVIVPKLVKHPIGIATDVILDVVESSADIDTTNIKAPGIQGSMIHDNKLILILDIYALFEQAEPEIYHQGDVSAVLSGKRILLAEDTVFFRHLESAYLRTAGCIVDCAKNGKEALEKLTTEKYDLVITDIMMPEMNGFELAASIKNTPATRHLPVVALTSMRDDKLEIQCKEIGFDAYELKLDKDKLLRTLTSLVKTASGGN